MNRLSISLVLLLSITARAQHYEFIQSHHPFDEGDGLWTPSSLQIEESLIATERYYLDKVQRDQEIQKLSEDVEIVIVVADELPADSSESTLVSQKEETGIDIKYIDFKKKIGAFVEDNSRERIRFIAIQHFPPEDVAYNADFPYQYPFTLYYNVENEKVGMNTVQTWDRDKSNPFDFPAAIYSPGPPYFLVPGRQVSDSRGKLGSALEN